jgi:hypothetical protein
MKLIQDPNHIKELMEIKEIADKTPRRGKPPKVQSNTQEETSDWLRPPFDPFRSLSQIPLVQINKGSFLSVDNDDEDITSHSVVPFLGTLTGKTATKSLEVRFQTRATLQLLTSGTRKARTSYRKILLLTRE